MAVPRYFSWHAMKQRVVKPDTWAFMYVFFTFNRSFYPSTSSTSSVCADSSMLVQRLYVTHVCIKHSRKGNAHYIIMDTTDTTYTFYKIDKRNDGTPMLLP